MISIARELESIAQEGLHYATDPYDRVRYERIRRIAAEIFAQKSNVSLEEVVEWNKTEFGHPTPKVAVSAFILSDDRVLLIREDKDDGRWTLPGGWADINESPSEAVAREVLEESGYRVAPLSLLAVYDREKQGHPPVFPFHIYKLFFHCTIVGGAPRATLESSESRFFPLDDLPELSTSRILAQQLIDFFHHIKSGKTSTAFD